MLPELDVLEEVGQLYMKELEGLPLEELDRLIKRVTQAKDVARDYENLLQAVLNHRFSLRSQQLRQDAGKSTGIVRFQDDGFTVISDLPKRTEYNQALLKDAVEALRKWGEDPEDYVGIEIKVSETKYGAWSSIEDAGYGKGYVAALNLWRQYIDGLNALRDDRGMAVVQIAHTDIKRFDSPEHDPYDRYVIKLHARAAALLQEHSDIVLFANYRISTVKADVGFNKKVSRAVGSGERVIHTVERPAFLAKNRYDLPDTLPLEWSAFAQAMPETLHEILTPTTNRT